MKSILGGMLIVASLMTLAGCQEPSLRLVLMVALMLRANSPCRVAHRVRVPSVSLSRDKSCPTSCWAESPQAQEVMTYKSCKMKYWVK